MDVRIKTFQEVTDTFAYLARLPGYTALFERVSAQLLKGAG